LRSKQSKKEVKLSLVCKNQPRSKVKTNREAPSGKKTPEAEKQLSLYSRNVKSGKDEKKIRLINEKPVI